MPAGELAPGTLQQARRPWRPVPVDWERGTVDCPAATGLACCQDEYPVQLSGLPGRVTPEFGHLPARGYVVGGDACQSIALWRGGQVLLI